MVKSPELSDVTDRAKCSKEEEKEEQGRTKQTALCGKSGKGGRERRGGGGATVEVAGKRNDGKRGA